MLTPILATAPLQLFAYHVSALVGANGCSPLVMERTFVFVRGTIFRLLFGASLCSPIGANSRSPLRGENRFYRGIRRRQFIFAPAWLNLFRS